MILENVVRACASRTLAVVLSLAFSVAVTAPGTRAEANPTVKEATEIAFEAYLYLYSLVLMDTTRRQMTNAHAGKVFGRGPMNIFTHARQFPPADFRDVVRPNFDTLYSSAWLDLTKGPIVMSVPDTRGRYYMLPMLDMWTNVFANPGTRSTGAGAGHFAVVPPGWSGKLPKGMVRIQATTAMVWIVGRTQTNGAKDYRAVHKVQNGYKLTPFADWGKGPPRAVKAKIDPNVDMKTPPMIQVDKMSVGNFFAYGLALMKVNPPQITDFDRLARMRRIGMVPGQRFDLNMAAPAVRTAIEKGARGALKAMLEKTKSIAPKVNGWQFAVENMGVYGTSYLRRAVIAMFGLGANKPEDAVYPSTRVDGKGRPLVGTNKYVLRFEAGKLPPANAFWSVTLYDKDGFPVPNRIKRQALGDRDKLNIGKDKSLTLYLQATSPGKGKESNWLPTPKSGPFNLTIRIYAPKQSVLLGKWAPPAVMQVK